MPAALGPPASRASHSGTRSGGFAPIAARQGRDPVARGSGLVVGDVVDARGAAVEREDRRRGGVLDVDEPEPPGALAHHREAPAADSSASEPPGA